MYLLLEMQNALPVPRRPTCLESEHVYRSVSPFLLSSTSADHPSVHPLVSYSVPGSIRERSRI